MSDAGWQQSAVRSWSPVDSVNPQRIAAHINGRVIDERKSRRRIGAQRFGGALRVTTPRWLFRADALQKLKYL